MLEWINNVCLRLLDPVLLPALRASWTLTILIVAGTTGLLLALSRKFLTNQDLLRRAADDKRRLKELIREAKRRDDREAVARHKALKGMIATRVFSQEMKPLLAVVLPVAILATWGYARLEFRTPQAGDKFEIRFYAPAAEVGQTAHLLPADGLSVEPGPIAEIAPATLAKERLGMASWTVAVGDLPPGERSRRMRLAVVVKGRTHEHELRAGRDVYAPAWAYFEKQEFAMQVRMREARFLGIVPGFGGAFPAWLVAYLIMAIPGAAGIRRVLRVA